MGGLTNTARESLFVVDIALYPGHQVFNVLRGRHFCWPLEVFCVLPKVLKSGPISFSFVERRAVSQAAHTRLWLSSRDMIEASKTL